MQIWKSVRTMRYRILLWTMVISLGLGNGVQAATISFDDGGIDSDWATPANWLGDALPTTADFVEILLNHTAEVSSPGAVASYVDIRDGGTLNVVGGDLTFGHANNRWLWVGWNSPGTVNQSGGTVLGVGNNADLVVDSYGTYRITGGLLDLADDLIMLDGATLDVAGNSTVIVRDDLRATFGSTTNINVELIGNSAPTISVSDDLLLQGNVLLNIDATQWTGGSDVELFQVAGNIAGNFSSVSVNGKLVPPSAYQVTGSGVVIPVTEPSTLAMAFAGLIGFAVIRRAHLQAQKKMRNRKTVPPLVFVPETPTPKFTKRIQRPFRLAKKRLLGANQDWLDD